MGTGFFDFAEREAGGSIISYSVCGPILKFWVNCDQARLDSFHS